MENWAEPPAYTKLFYPEEKQARSEFNISNIQRKVPRISNSPNKEKRGEKTGPKGRTKTTLHLKNSSRCQKSKNFQKRTEIEEDGRKNERERTKRRSNVGNTEQVDGQPAAKNEAKISSHQ
jgi:hypothetical protein